MSKNLEGKTPNFVGSQPISLKQHNSDPGQSPRQCQVASWSIQLFNHSSTQLHDQQNRHCAQFKCTVHITVNYVLTHQRVEVSTGYTWPSCS